ncbi:MAG TPA: amidohydrolase [Actinocrinis sp.]|jgi:amidohydrolase|uniref:amidohydrolase n=1 Tax=Actinocrinis sp. TaxID=1920516 RepID=UPI002DDD6335|nr:amidohydrolase [Actinocrinis sp.]HEV3168902.1 amidohydrolase [Actinocrinis sp.]
MNLILPLESERHETADPASRLEVFLAQREDELIEFRRDIHAHPELARKELRTTARLVERLEAAGLAPRPLPTGAGLVCDIDPVEGVRVRADLAPFNDADVDHAHLTDIHLDRVALHDAFLDAAVDHAAHWDGRLAIRADIDALPIQESDLLPYRSTVEGVSHACGHDLHTATVLGAGLFLAEEARAGRLTRPVRLIFQPAEEVLPGGALDMIDAGALDGVARIIGVHCDPRVDAGHIGLREGPLTAACDKIAIKLSGPGGHTSRPHLTVDLIYALASLVTELPAALSRRIDPRAGVSLVWGAINAGHAANAIPQYGEAHGTVRAMDQRAWAIAPDLLLELVDAVASVYGAKTELNYVRGVPPVVNDEHVVDLMREAAHLAAGLDGVVPVEQSMGGEDFSWYLQKIPGAMARLGVRTPGDPTPRDLHQPTFLADESAIAVGVRFFAHTALLS